MLRFLKIFSPKNLRFFAQTTASFLKKLTISLFFEKTPIFFRRKLAKLAENCDHNIDPRFSAEFRLENNAEKNRFSAEKKNLPEKSEL
jgi:hypothetical protein